MTAAMEFWARSWRYEGMGGMGVGGLGGYSSKHSDRKQNGIFLKPYYDICHNERKEHLDNIKLRICL